MATKTTAKDLGMYRISLVDDALTNQVLADVRLSHVDKSSNLQRFWGPRILGLKRFNVIGTNAWIYLQPEINYNKKHVYT